MSMHTASSSDLPLRSSDADLANPETHPSENITKPETLESNSGDELHVAQAEPGIQSVGSIESDTSGDSTGMDYILYSGGLQRGDDLKFIEYISDEQDADGIVLILCTHGGEADAAYKIGRYIQSVYDSFKLFIPGHCKSAGTLLAIAAQEIVFSPYGELGPLDVQMARPDNIASMESGLNISEAFLTLEDRARRTFHNLIVEITRMSEGIVSFQTASRSASEIVGELYGPIFSQIEPEDVGSRSRAMRIGEDYGTRLDQKFKNLLPNALDRLSQSYASHGFVIDQLEAAALFDNVRESTDAEKTLAQELGRKCLVPDTEPCVENVTSLYKDILSRPVANEEFDA